jgi:hypothetical protein
MDWATFWAKFAQTHPVTLNARQARDESKISKLFPLSSQRSATKKYVFSLFGSMK